MSALVLYKLPHSNRGVKIEQDKEPLEISSLTELNNKQGFVIAPFKKTENTPILLIQPDRIEYLTFELDDNKASIQQDNITFNPKERAKEKNSYFKDFHDFHKKLEDGTFSKLVLARCSEEKKVKDIAVSELFYDACRLYPNQFVALFCSKATGIWLMATPETLLNGNQNEWNTVALAGTMNIADSPISISNDTNKCKVGIDFWTDKNKEEQQYVANYIKDALIPFCSRIDESSPYTYCTKSLMHIRSDFSFVLKDNMGLGTILDVLHPTPAVCGIPKNEAWKYIMENESTERGYYSGFVGSLDIEGETNLYVCLRCMKIEDDRYLLYAGGGLLKESNAESEWNETESKLQTMRSLIHK